VEGERPSRFHFLRSYFFSPSACPPSRLLCPARRTVVSHATVRPPAIPRPLSTAVDRLPPVPNAAGPLRLAAENQQRTAREREGGTKHSTRLATWVRPTVFAAPLHSLPALAPPSVAWHTIWTGLHSKSPTVLGAIASSSASGQLQLPNPRPALARRGPLDALRSAAYALLAGASLATPAPLRECVRGLQPEHESEQLAAPRVSRAPRLDDVVQTAGRSPIPTIATTHAVSTLRGLVCAILGP